jgi:benzil reductase ((S)-benzoin forming)
MSSARLALVTGTSSGIGAAVARELLRREWQVVGIARRTPAIEDERYRHLALDLADVPAATAAIERDFGARLGERAWERVGLVNNAAAAPAGRAQNLQADELLRSYALNAVIPLWLMGFLVRRRPAQSEVRVVNVSSGAAQRAFPGLAAYCSGKAALRMAGMAVAAEIEGGLSILSYEPGVVDTEMQLAARSRPLEDFPWGETFRRFHEEGRLVPPELPAADIVEFLGSSFTDHFKEGRYGT